MTDRFWELMARRQSGELTQQENTELEKFLLAYPDYWLKAGLAEQLTFRATPLLPDREAEKLADSIQDRILQEALAEEIPLQRHSWLYRRRADILLLTLVCGITAFVIYHSRETGNTAAWKEVTTAPGTKTSIILAGGTNIRLNAGSVLRYPAEERRHNSVREVFLEGEAYFDVKQDAAQPFIIHIAAIDIKVLGTALNVRAYPDEGFSETLLVSGAVEVAVQAGDSARKFLLKPGQKIVMDHKTAPQHKSGVRIEPVSLPAANSKDELVAETAWTADRLVFRNETLSALALRLERWYGVTITISDTALAAKRFTGQADNVPLPQVLAILQSITPFDYTMQEQHVIIQ